MVDFKVISGDAARPPAWLDFPKRVEVRSHLDQNRIGQCRVCSERALLFAAAHRRQPAFELWSVILSTAPPVPNVAYHRNQPITEGLSHLTDARACFYGLERPVAGDDHGDEILTFVLSPSAYYRFDNSYDGAMACVARRLPVPENLLFLAHIRLDQPCGTGETPMLGALTHWGFVERSTKDRSLPIDFETRFKGRHW